MTRAISWLRGWSLAAKLLGGLLLAGGAVGTIAMTAAKAEAGQVRQELEPRVSSIETEQKGTTGRLDRIERALERQDGKLDRLLQEPSVCRRR